jgi:hypothetical protein
VTKSKVNRNYDTSSVIAGKSFVITGSSKGQMISKDLAESLVASIWFGKFKNNYLLMGDDAEGTSNTKPSAGTTI